MSESEYSRTVKWLSRARELERRIEARTEQAERLRQSLLPGAASGGGMPRGSGADWTDRAAAAIEIERDIAAELRRLRRAREEIVRAIEDVPDGDQRTVLDMRYIGGYKFARIAGRLHYDRTWVWRLHNRGVMAVARMRARG